MRRLFAESAADDADRVPILVDRGDPDAPQTGDYRIGALCHSARLVGEVVQDGHGLSAG